MVEKQKKYDLKKRVLVVSKYGREGFKIKILLGPNIMAESLKIEKQS